MVVLKISLLTLKLLESPLNKHNQVYSVQLVYVWVLAEAKLGYILDFQVYIGHQRK